MKNWNIHSTWIIGILIALLIGQISTDWVSVKNLPELISFAVGISSLVLAVIAIFQTLMSTGSVDASLAHMRDSAANSLKVSADLAATTEKIQQAANKAHAASSEALAATSDFTLLSAKILQTNQDGQNSINRLREEMRDSFNVGSTSKTNEDKNRKFSFVYMRYGGAAAAYAAIRSAEMGKSFRLEDIFPDEKPYADYENGYIMALSDIGGYNAEWDDGVITISNLTIDAKSAKTYLRNTTFDDTELDRKHSERMSRIDEFFGPDLID